MLPKEALSLPQDTPLSSAFKPNFTKNNEHEVSLDLLGESGNRGCSVCIYLKAAIMEYYGANEVEDITWTPGGFYVGPTMDSWDTFALAGDNDALPKDGMNSSLEAQSYHPYLGRFDIPCGDTGSKKALDRLRKWLSRCTDEHTHCGEADPKSMPHRVLEIEDCKTARVRLIDSRDMREKYACLSHRWCPETVIASLLQGNFEEYTQRVPDTALYALLRDAVLIAGLAGLRFIWIDCLCIIQDDSNDWTTEAATMASVYENAFLTIASSGCDNSSTLFSKAPQSFVTEIKPPGSVSVLVRPQLQHPVWRRADHYCEFSTAPEYPLMSRAWVYQERMLSRRTVHFTRQELVWECVESIWCECDSGYAPLSDTSSVNIPLKHFPLRDYFRAPWGNIVAAFTKLNLTFGSDRLPALSGVAKRYGQYHGLTYLAGLWKEILERDFFWALRARSLSDGDLGPRPEPRFAPTWSWASVKGFTCVLGRENSDGNPCEFLTFHGHDIEAVPGGDGFGKLLKAQLYVSGPVIFGTLLYPASWENPKSMRDLERCHFQMGQEVFKFQVDYDFTFPGPNFIHSGEQIACLLVHSEGTMPRRNGLLGPPKANGIVLRPVQGLELTFERIGHIGGSLYAAAPDAAYALERAQNLRITLV